jgi:hypothetical protein
MGLSVAFLWKEKVRITTRTTKTDILHIELCKPDELYPSTHSTMVLVYIVYTWQSSQHSTYKKIMGPTCRTLLSLTHSLSHRLMGRRRRGTLTGGSQRPGMRSSTRLLPSLVGMCAGRTRAAGRQQVRSDRRSCLPRLSPPLVWCSKASVKTMCGLMFFLLSWWTIVECALCMWACMGLLLHNKISCKSWWPNKR